MANVAYTALRSLKQWMLIDPLMMQPDSGARDFAFVRARGLLRMSEGLSAMTVTPDLCTVVGTVDWKVPTGFPGKMGYYRFSISPPLIHHPPNYENGLREFVTSCREMHPHRQSTLGLMQEDAVALDAPACISQRSLPSGYL